MESWLATVREANPDSDPIPAYVENELRKVLTCGILCHGFCRCRCTDPRCGHECLVAFSCRARAVCSSCCARYMAQTGACLVDNVLPRVPYRQWVLVVPKRLRYYLQCNPTHASRVLRILLRALDTAVRKASPGAPPEARIGAVSFIQRFGESLNEHLHYHSVVTDGVFSETPGGEVNFFEATDFTQELIERLCKTLRRRILRYFVRHGLLDESVAEDMLAWEHEGGFSLDASVRIESWDRPALERLVRYCARPPVAESRLHRSDDEKIIYQVTGSEVRAPESLVMTPFELLQRLSALVPPPRVHRHRFWGVLAPHCKLRGKAIESAAPAGVMAAQLQQAATRMGICSGQECANRPAGDDTPRQETGGSAAGLPTRSNKSALGRRLSVMWAMLVARIYETLPLLCPRCGQPMKIISFITEPDTIGKILRHIGEPTEPPPISPARAPPQCDLEFYEEEPA